MENGERRLLVTLSSALEFGNRLETLICNKEGVTTKSDG